MSAGGNSLSPGSGAGGSDSLASEFVDGGSIKIAKLVSTLLGALWLTVVSGWITVVEAIVTVHVRVLDAAADLYVGVITAFGAGGADTLRTAWGEAFRAAVDASPLLAPTIMSLEVVVVSAFLLYARRRWT